MKLDEIWEGKLSLLNPILDVSFPQSKDVRRMGEDEADIVRRALVVAVLRAVMKRNPKILLVFEVRQHTRDCRVYLNYRVEFNGTR